MMRNISVWSNNSFLFCLRQLKELLDTYYPIEIDSSRSIDEKMPLMVEW